MIMEGNPQPFSYNPKVRELDREFWFVDMFHRNGLNTESHNQFMRIMAVNEVKVPTANHAFGWDNIKFVPWR